MNQTMKQYDTLFKRYWDEAEYYARLYGVDFKKNSDGAWDAFRHAYASAAMSRERSPWMAHVFGDANEYWVTGTSPSTALISIWIAGTMPSDVDWPRVRRTTTKLPTASMTR
jgi:hypothetical protein